MSKDLKAFLIGLFIGYAFVALLSLIGCGDQMSIPGPQGSKGDTGAQGSQGEKGDVGEAGQTGAQGVAGATGTTGATGSVGATGATGATGAAGNNGAPGTQITVVQLCGSCVGAYPSVFPEIALCMNNKLLAVYSANGGFMVELSNGYYSSQGINCTCSFHVNGCSVN